MRPPWYPLEVAPRWQELQVSQLQRLLSKISSDLQNSTGAVHQDSQSGYPSTICVGTNMNEFSTRPVGMSPLKRYSAGASWKDETEELKKRLTSLRQAWTPQDAKSGKRRDKSAAARLQHLDKIQRERDQWARESKFLEQQYIDVHNQLESAKAKAMREAAEAKHQELQNAQKILKCLGTTLASKRDLVFPQEPSRMTQEQIIVDTFLTQIAERRSEVR